MPQTTIADRIAIFLANYRGDNQVLVQLLKDACRELQGGR